MFSSEIEIMITTIVAGIILGIILMLAVEGFSNKRKILGALFVSVCSFTMIVSIQLFDVNFEKTMQRDATSLLIETEILVGFSFCHVIAGLDYIESRKVMLNNRRLITGLMLFMGVISSKNLVETAGMTYDYLIAKENTGIFMLLLLAGYTGLVSFVITLLIVEKVFERK